MLCFVTAGPAAAASLQPLGNFDKPIDVVSDPGNPDRLFVAERSGRIQQLLSGAVTSFADLRPIVGCGGGCVGERGLLSLAPAPDFPISGRFYVDYAENTGGSIHVAELRQLEGTASIDTLRNVLTIPHPNHANHNGGQIHFGPDGYLYLSTGDGGGENDAERNAQDLESLLGKMLRIDPRQSGTQPYTVPPGNPFVAMAGARPEIWSYGLRNPFRFSFDRLSGDLTIGDVGQEAREEVNHSPAPALGAGANYGWSCREGFLAGPAEDPACLTASGFVAPVYDYPHEDPGNGGAHGCAIIGGYVVRDVSLGDLYGRYLYGDLCSGQIRSVDLDDPTSDRSEGLSVPSLYSFGEDACGRLYVISGDGPISRLVGATTAVCPPPAPPVPPPPPPDQETPTAPAAGGSAGAAAPAAPPGPGGSRPGRVATELHLKALRVRVSRGARATLVVSVSPCAGRPGDPVQLWRGSEPAAKRNLNAECQVGFHPRIRHRSSFKATIGAGEESRAATSRRLIVRPRD
jgi:hypothetical protein